MPPPIVVRADITLPGGYTAFSNVHELKYPWHIGQYVYMGKEEYVVDNFNENKIVIATVDDAGTWLYQNVDEGVLWLPVHGMPSFLQTLVRGTARKLV